MSRYDDCDAYPDDDCPVCQRCGRNLTREEAAAAEAGEDEGLCEDCAEHVWYASQDVA